MPKTFWLAIAISWTITIAVLCLMRFGELPSVGVEEADKYVHAAFHFFFTIFWSQYLLKGKETSRSKILGRVLVFSIVYGSLIEIAQGLFTTTRQADFKDVVANFAGAAVAFLLMFATNRQRKSHQQ